MTRTLTLIALLLSWLALASGGSAGGTAFAAGRMVHVGTAAVQMAQGDCQMEAFCPVSCNPCAAALHSVTSEYFENSSKEPVWHPALFTRPLSERLYRPPRSNSPTTI